MANTFFISDTHFTQESILTFKNKDGSPLRDFSSVQEMDEHMVEKWNSVVRPQDKVYHLGDVVMHRRALPILSRLNGHKRLVRGNHDIFKTKDYLQYFEEIYGVRVFPNLNMVCSHIPIHIDSMYRWKLNLHGHLHANSLNDPKYACVSVEQINYTPVSIDEIVSKYNL